MTTTARDIMTQGAECVGESETLVDAARKMRDLDVGALPICGEDERLKGMLTDRDIVVRCLAAGGDPAAAIARHGEWVGHVQVSDWPGRGAPGTGSLPVWELLGQLRAGGYDGAVGLEYEPGGPTEATLGFMREAPVAGLFE